MGTEAEDRPYFFIPRVKIFFNEKKAEICSIVPVWCGISDHHHFDSLVSSFNVTAKKTQFRITIPLLGESWLGLTKGK